MPADLVAKIKKAENFNQGYKLTELVAAAELDMQWHTLPASAPAAGKGIGAVLLMANLQAAVRSQCAMAWEQPERFIQSVNQLLYENTGQRELRHPFLHRIRR